MAIPTSTVKLTDEPLQIGKYQGSYIQEVWGSDPDYIFWLGSEAINFPDYILGEAAMLRKDSLAAGRFLDGEPPMATRAGGTVYVVLGRMYQEGPELREVHTDETSAIWSAISLAAFGEIRFDVWEILGTGHRLRVFRTEGEAVVPPTDWSFTEVKRELIRSERSIFKTTYKLRRVGWTMGTIVSAERRRQKGGYKSE